MSAAPDVAQQTRRLADYLSERACEQLLAGDLVQALELARQRALLLRHLEEADASGAARALRRQERFGRIGL